MVPKGKNQKGHGYNWPQRAIFIYLVPKSKIPLLYTNKVAKHKRTILKRNPVKESSIQKQEKGTWCEVVSPEYTLYTNCDRRERVKPTPEVGGSMGDVKTGLTLVFEKVRHSCSLLRQFLCPSRVCRWKTPMLRMISKLWKLPHFILENKFVLVPMG